jgi:MFS family permease
MNRILTLLAFVTFSSGLFIRSADPIILQFATGMNVDPATAALLSTAFALPYALIQPVLGVLADMFSKARLMLICLAVVALASVACALAPNFETLLIARVIAGLGAGGMMPIILALIGDLVPVAGRQVAISRILFAVMSGILIGSFGAGALADLFDWRTVFAVMAGMGFVVLAIAVPGLRNVALTAPYFHDGTAASLDEAVAVMGRFQLGRELTAEDVRAISAFLHTLTGRWQGQYLQ